MNGLLEIHASYYFSDFDLFDMFQLVNSQEKPLLTRKKRQEQPQELAPIPGEPGTKERIAFYTELVSNGEKIPTTI